MIEKITVTPFRRSAEHLSTLSRPVVPRGAHITEISLEGERGPVDRRGRLRPVTPADPRLATFSQAEIEAVQARTQGKARLSRIRTESGVTGEILEGSDGKRMRVALPSGVLPEPLVIESEPGKVRAETAAGLALTARENDRRVEVEMPNGTLAVFDRESFTFGQENPETLEAERTRLEKAYRISYFDEDSQVRVGDTLYRQNVGEYLHADGGREIIADRSRRYTAETNGFNQSISYYRIRQHPSGNVSAQHVVEGRDNAWFTSGTSWDYSAKVTHPMTAQRTPDGSYVLTRQGGLRRFVADVTNRLKNLWTMQFVGEHLRAQPADQVVVQPFSADPQP